MPDVHVREMKHFPSPSACLETKVRLLEKKEVTLIQSADGRPNCCSDQHESADKGFNLYGLRVMLLFAGKPARKQPAQQRFVEQLGCEGWKVGNRILRGAVTIQQLAPRNPALGMLAHPTQCQGQGIGLETRIGIEQ